MKYFVSATPGPMPPTPEQFDAAFAWLEDKADDGTFDCIYRVPGGRRLQRRERRLPRAMPSP